MELTELRVYESFLLEEALGFFEDRKWSTQVVKASESTLVPTSIGAALECGDGRFDFCPDREKYGPRVFGGLNAIMAMVTGGDLQGFIRASRVIERLGYKPGTHSAEHGGCGYWDLWRAGKLKSAPFDHCVPTELIEKQGFKLGDWVKMQMKMLGGKHFRLTGEHQEAALRINPFIGTTECVANGLRFRVDDWFLAQAGVLFRQRLLHYAEVVEQLKPDASRVEIIFPC